MFDAVFTRARELIGREHRSRRVGDPNVRRDGGLGGTPQIAVRSVALHRGPLRPPFGGTVSGGGVAADRLRSGAAARLNPPKAGGPSVGGIRGEGLVPSPRISVS